MANERYSDPIFAYLVGAKPRKSDLTKISIIKGTIEYLNHHSIESLTLARIGKFAGVRHSHVAYYFPNRNDLIEAALRYIAAAWQAHGTLAIEGIQDPHQLLEATITADFTWVEKEASHKPLIGLLLYFASLGGRYRDMFWKLREEGLSELVATLSKCLPGTSSGRIQGLARDIQHLTTGKALEYVCAPEKYTAKALAKETIRIVRLLLREAEKKPT